MNTPKGWKDRADEIERHIAEGTMSAAQVYTQMRQLLAAAPAPPVPPSAEVGEAYARAMTPERAAYFLRRFKHDEKMLGPNEQAALDFCIARLAAPPPASLPGDEGAVPSGVEELRKAYHAAQPRARCEGAVAWVQPETLADLLAKKPWTAGAIGEFCQRRREPYTVPLFAHPAPDAALHARTEGERARAAFIAGYTQGAHDHTDVRLNPAELGVDAREAADFAGYNTTPPAPLAPARSTAEELASALGLVRTDDGWNHYCDLDSPLFSHAKFQRAASALSAKSGGVVDAWRPISEAPRDGTPILGGHPRFVRAALFEWDDEYRNWWTNDSEAKGCPQPTHWQPLPPPPAALTPGAKGESDNAAMLSGKREGE